MPLPADRLKVPPIATTLAGLGMTLLMPGGGVCGVGCEVAVAGTVEAVGLTGKGAGVEEAGFPQAPRTIAPTKRPDNRHRWE